MASCYVYGLQQNAPEVYKKYGLNERAIHRILSGDDVEAASVLGAWISENCPDGFRWHVSGDVMNGTHAEWIVMVARASSSIRHWIYTRSLWLAPILIRAKNLVVNISADASNYWEARGVADWLDLRLCYMTRDGKLPDDMREGEVIFPDYSLRGRNLENPTEHDWWKGLSIERKRMVCPADFFGQSEQHRCGPCEKCMIQQKGMF
jgi:hypothetical protein